MPLSTGEQNRLTCKLDHALSRSRRLLSPHAMHIMIDRSAPVICFAEETQPSRSQNPGKSEHHPVRRARESDPRRMEDNAAGGEGHVTPPESPLKSGPKHSPSETRSKANQLLQTTLRMAPTSKRGGSGDARKQTQLKTCSQNPSRKVQFRRVSFCRCQRQTVNKKVVTNVES